MHPGGTNRTRIHVARVPGAPLVPLAAAALHAEGAAACGVPDARIFGALIRRLREEFEFVTAAGDADVVICGHDASTQPRACRQASAAARSAGIPTFVYSESDDVRPSDPRLGIVYRSSVLGRLLRPHERIATGCVPDLTAERTPGTPEWAPAGGLPTLGFMGHVAHGIASARYLHRGWQHFYGFTLRDRVLRAFERTSEVSCSFTRRSTNLGPPMAGVEGDLARRAMRREYVGSVFGNLYSLCIRGAGNWSYRFFEALSAGRIPVLIDTDCILPLESMIDWNRHICRIPVGRIGEAGRLLAEYHAAQVPAQLEAKQAANRALWQERLSPAAFFPRALRELAGAAGEPGGDTMTAPCAGSPVSSCSTARGRIASASRR